MLNSQETWLLHRGRDNTQRTWLIHREHGESSTSHMTWSIHREYSQFMVNTSILQTTHWQQLVETKHSLSSHHKECGCFTEASYVTSQRREFTLQNTMRLHITLQIYSIFSQRTQHTIRRHMSRSKNVNFLQLDLSLGQFLVMWTVLCHVLQWPRRTLTNTCSIITLNKNLLWTLNTQSY